MKLDFLDLRLFVSIAEYANLTLGAEKLFLSPPAASARLKAMEAELGGPLFVRGNKGVSLTADGARFLKQARLVLRQMDYLKDEMAQAETGHLRVFANTTAVTEFLPEILARFLADKPQVTVDLQERLTQDIARSVLDGICDLGVVSGEVPDIGLEAIRFSTDRLMLCVPTGHDLASHEKIRFKHALDFEHISLHEGSTLLDFLTRQFRFHGHERMPRVKLRSFEAMCRMIEAGVGIGVVPESAARRHAHTMAIKLLELQEPWALRDRLVLVRAQQNLPPSARTLIDLLVEAGAGGEQPE